MSAMDFLHQIRLGSYQLALSVPGILKLCNYLQNVAAITYIFGLQLSTFLFYNKHFRMYLDLQLRRQFTSGSTELQCQRLIIW